MATPETTTKEIPAQASPGTKDTPEDGGDSEDPDLTKDYIVPFTSRVMAAARAIESRRPDRLFNDCFAELLAGEESIRLCAEPTKIFMGDNESEPRLGEKGGKESSNDAGTNDLDQCLDGTDAPSAGYGDDFKRQMAIRTKYGDDFFENCTLSPRNIKQIVLLGAGMDTRGYRLRAGPDTTVFEVDQAMVLSHKRKLLSGMSPQKMISDNKMNGCEARVVEVEAYLEKTGWEGKLVEAGFNPALPSAWMLEGLVMYLEKHDVAKLLQIIANHSSPGSAFCVSTISEEWFEYVERIKSGTWKWGSDDPKPFFEDHFPRTWSWKYVTIGTPGEFPDGADYSVGYKGRGQGYVLGYAA